MTKAARVVPALLLLALAVAGRAAAQGQERQGFWIAFGVGYGSLGYSCDGCGSVSREGGIAGHLGLGITLRSNILVGLDVESWNKSENGDWVRISNFTGAVLWYPMTDAGFFVKGGAGLATASGGVGAFSLSGTGFGYTVGVGYDVPVSHGLVLTPAASYFGGSVGNISTGSVAAVTGWSQNVFKAGLDITLP